MRFPLTTLTHDESELRAEVRDFLTTSLPEPMADPSFGIGGGWDREFTKRLAERGWVGLSVPEEYGGAGASAVERFVVVEELLAASAPVSAHWVADRQTAPSILKFGSEALKREFLPRIAAGECFFSIGMSEPDAGSDLASVRTAARRTDGGWLVNGTKIWTSGAQRNDYFVVLCRTSPVTDNRHEGLSQLIVDLRSPGLTVRPIESVEGQRHFNEVVFDDVFVPDVMVLGDLGDGWRQVTSELAYERSGPDRWLSTFPLFRSMLGLLAGSAEAATVLGELAARYRAIRELSLSVARMIDAGGAPAAEAALVKDLGTKFEQRVITDLHRHIGTELDPDSPVLHERLMSAAILAAPSFTLRGGTTEILRSVASKTLITQAGVAR